jgi:hypothetical protein
MKMIIRMMKKEETKLEICVSLKLMFIVGSFKKRKSDSVRVRASTSAMGVLKKAETNLKLEKPPIQVSLPGIYRKVHTKRRRNSIDDGLTGSG